MFKRMLVVLVAMVAVASSLEAQGVSVKKSEVVPVSEIEDAFDYSKCGISYASPKAGQRVRMPRGAEFRLLTANELPIWCVRTTILALGVDGVFQSEVLLPGQNAVMSVDPDAWDWGRAPKGATIVGSIAGLACGVLGGGDIGHRAGNVAKCAAVGAAAGAVGSAAPRRDRGQRDVVVIQVTTSVVDESGTALASQCREYEVRRGEWRQNAHMIVINNVRDVRGDQCGDDRERSGSGGRRFLYFTR